MTISICDLVALALLVLFGFVGYKRGAIDSLIDLVGLIVALLAAWFLSGWLTDKLMNLTVVQSALKAWVENNNVNLNAVLPLINRIAQIFVFLLLFIIINAFMRKVKVWMRGVNQIPVVGLINKLAGAFIGIATGIVFITVVVGVLYYAAVFAKNTSMQEVLSTSSFLQLFIAAVQ